MGQQDMHTGSGLHGLLWTIAECEERFLGAALFSSRGRAVLGLCNVTIGNFWCGSLLRLVAAVAGPFAYATTLVESVKCDEETGRVLEVKLIAYSKTKSCRISRQLKDLDQQRAPITPCARSDAAALHSAVKSAQQLGLTEHDLRATSLRMQLLRTLADLAKKERDLKELEADDPVCVDAQHEVDQLEQQLTALITVYKQYMQQPNRNSSSVLAHAKDSRQGMQQVTGPATQLCHAEPVQQCSAVAADIQQPTSTITAVPQPSDRLMRQSPDPAAIICSSALNRKASASAPGTSLAGALQQSAINTMKRVVPAAAAAGKTPAVQIAAASEAADTHQLDQQWARNKLKGAKQAGVEVAGHGCHLRSAAANTLVWSGQVTWRTPAGMLSGTFNACGHLYTPAAATTADSLPTTLLPTGSTSTSSNYWSRYTHLPQQLEFVIGTSASSFMTDVWDKPPVDTTLSSGGGSGAVSISRSSTAPLSAGWDLAPLVLVPQSKQDASSLTQLMNLLRSTCKSGALMASSQFEVTCNTSTQPKQQQQRLVGHSFISYNPNGPLLDLLQQQLPPQHRRHWGASATVPTAFSAKGLLYDAANPVCIMATSWWQRSAKTSSAAAVGGSTAVSADLQEPTAATSKPDPPPALPATLAAATAGAQQLKQQATRELQLLQAAGWQQRTAKQPGQQQLQDELQLQQQQQEFHQLMQRSLHSSRQQHMTAQQRLQGELHPVQQQQQQQAPKDDWIPQPHQRGPSTTPLNLNATAASATAGRNQHGPGRPSAAMAADTRQPTSTSVAALAASDTTQQLHQAGTAVPAAAGTGPEGPASAAEAATAEALYPGTFIAMKSNKKMCNLADKSINSSLLASRGRAGSRVTQSSRSGTSKSRDSSISGTNDRSHSRSRSRSKSRNSPRDLSRSRSLDSRSPSRTASSSRSRSRSRCSPRAPSKSRSRSSRGRSHSARSRKPSLSKSRTHSRSRCSPRALCKSRSRGRSHGDRARSRTPSLSRSRSRVRDIGSRSRSRSRTVSTRSRGRSRSRGRRSNRSIGRSRSRSRSSSRSSSRSFGLSASRSRSRSCSDSRSSRSPSRNTSSGKNAATAGHAERWNRSRSRSASSSEDDGSLQQAYANRGRPRARPSSPVGPVRSASACARAAATAELLERLNPAMLNHDEQDELRSAALLHLFAEAVLYKPPELLTAGQRSFIRAGRLFQLELACEPLDIVESTIPVEQLQLPPNLAPEHCSLAEFISSPRCTTLMMQSGRYVKAVSCYMRHIRRHKLLHRLLVQVIGDMRSPGFRGPVPLNDLERMMQLPRYDILMVYCRMYHSSRQRSFGALNFVADNVSGGPEVLIQRGPDFDLVLRYSLTPWAHVVVYKAPRHYGVSRTYVSDGDFGWVEPPEPPAAARTVSPTPWVQAQVAAAAVQQTPVPAAIRAATVANSTCIRQPGQPAAAQDRPALPPITDLQFSDSEYTDSGRSHGTDQSRGRKRARSPSSKPGSSSRLGGTQRHDASSWAEPLADIQCRREDGSVVDNSRQQQQQLVSIPLPRKLQEALQRVSLDGLSSQGSDEIRSVALLHVFAAVVSSRQSLAVQWPAPANVVSKITAARISCRDLVLPDHLMPRVCSLKEFMSNRCSMLKLTGGDCIEVHPWFMDKVRQQQLPQLLLRQLVQQLLSRQDVKQEYVSSSDIGSWMACVKEYCPLLLYRQLYSSHKQFLLDWIPVAFQGSYVLMTLDEIKHQQHLLVPAAETAAAQRRGFRMMT